MDMKKTENTDVVKEAGGEWAGLQSKVISFLRFPLIVGVLLIHSHPHSVTIAGISIVDGQNLTVYSCIRFLFSNVLAATAVPLFFFISGFLFFKGNFTAETYAGKLKKRCKSLLIPYLFWNLTVIALYYLLQTFMPGMASGANKAVAEYTFSDWARSFWDSYYGMPVCYPFWFIRDLMVVMVFSPLVYAGIKLLGQWFVVATGVLWFFDLWFDVPGFGIAALFFFSAGGYFNIRKESFLQRMMPLMTCSAAAYPVICLVCVILRDTPAREYLVNLSIPVGITCVMTITAHCLRKGKWRVNGFLSESSFFIYAYHSMVLTLIVKASVIAITEATSLTLLAVYFSSVALTIGIGLGIYYLLRRFLPGLTNFITGR